MRWLFCLGLGCVRRYGWWVVGCSWFIVIDCFVDVFLVLCLFFWLLMKWFCRLIVFWLRLCWLVGVVCLNSWWWFIRVCVGILLSVWCDILMICVSCVRRCFCVCIGFCISIVVIVCWSFGWCRWCIWLFVVIWSVVVFLLLMFMMMRMVSGGLNRWVMVWMWKWWCCRMKCMFCCMWWLMCCCFCSVLYWCFIIWRSCLLLRLFIWLIWLKVLLRVICFVVVCVCVFCFICIWGNLYEYWFMYVCWGCVLVGIGMWLVGSDGVFCGIDGCG